MHAITQQTAQARDQRWSAKLLGSDKHSSSNQKRELLCGPTLGHGGCEEVKTLQGQTGPITPKHCGLLKNNKALQLFLPWDRSEVCSRMVRMQRNPGVHGVGGRTCQSQREGLEPLGKLRKVLEREGRPKRPKAVWEDCLRA